MTLPPLHVRRDALAATMTMPHRVRKGVRVPKPFFRTGPAHERTALFDTAYDLACHRLGVSFVDVMEDEHHLRFLPSLFSIG